MRRPVGSDTRETRRARNGFVPDAAFLLQPIPMVRQCQRQISGARPGNRVCRSGQIEAVAIPGLSTLAVSLSPPRTSIPGVQTLLSFTETLKKALPGFFAARLSKTRFRKAFIYRRLDA